MPVTKTNIAARILAGKTNPSSSSRRVPVMFGRLNLKLKSPCPDVKRLLGNGCTQGVRAFLISPVKYNDVVYHYLKVKDWENVYYCEVEMDYRMETAEGRKVFKYFFSGFQDNYVKAFLTYECHGNGGDPVVTLELWAMEKCCVSDDHLEAPQNANFRKHSYSFVELLYPEMFAQHQEKLMAEGIKLHVLVSLVHNTTCTRDTMQHLKGKDRLNFYLCAAQHCVGTSDCATRPFLA